MKSFAAEPCAPLLHSLARAVTPRKDTLVKQTALVACLCCLAAASLSAKKPKPPKDPQPLGAAFAVSSCTTPATCRQELPAVTGATSVPKRRAPPPPDGFFVAWQGGSPKDFRGISARLFKGASPLTSDFLASKNVPPDQYDVALTQDKGAAANFVAVWSESAGGNSEIMARRFAASGAPLGEPFKVNVDAAGTPSVPLDFKPAVASSPHGGFVVVWTKVIQAVALSNTNPQVLVRRFDGAGVPLGPQAVLNTGLATTDRPGVCVDASGNIDAVWATVDHYRPFEANKWGVAARRLSAAGLPLAAEAVVALPTAGGPTTPVVSCSGSSFVVAWQSDQAPAVNGFDIVAQRYNQVGAKIGAAILVNRQATAEHQANPSISPDASGNFVIAWQSRLTTKVGIFARRFSTGGAELSNAFEVFSRPFGDVIGPSVAHTSTNGNFVVVWQDASTVRGRRYSP